MCISCDKGLDPTILNGEIIVINWKMYNTENSNIPDNSIKSLAVDNTNNIWVGTFSKGLAKFDGNTWTIYNTQNSGLPDNSIWCIESDNDNVWVGTENGLGKFDGFSWTVFDTVNSPLPYNVISALAFDYNNILWIGCGHFTNGGVISFNKNTWNLYSKANSLLPSSIINIIEVDEQNNKWIGTGAGLVKIDNQNILSVFTDSSIILKGVNAIAKDLNNNLWVGGDESERLNFGHYYGYLLKYDGRSWTDFSPNPNGKYNPNAVTSNRIKHMASDKYGNLFIATAAEWEFPYNLSLFHNGIWKNLSSLTTDFPQNLFIRDIKIGKNKTIWLATQIGLIAIEYSIK